MIWEDHVTLTAASNGKAIISFEFKIGYVCQECEYIQILPVLRPVSRTGFIKLALVDLLYGNVVNRHTYRALVELVDGTRDNRDSFRALVGLVNGVRDNRDSFSALVGLVNGIRDNRDSFSALVGLVNGISIIIEMASEPW
ncbi:hypothetical protein RRG08_022521 [Elysia crispata]|uniref:Uncharacterized protein n=1 Tax=Elysia crispata TaxID=231223 RepID=A0AAE1D8F8_9GAST|nr:hypothetical protein RRG08_022521 [Elysia crispata]